MKEDFRKNKNEDNFHDKLDPKREKTAILVSMVYKGIYINP